MQIYVISFRDTDMLSTVLFALIYFDRCLCILCTVWFVFCLMNICAVNMLFVMHYEYVVAVF